MELDRERVKLVNRAKRIHGQMERVEGLIGVVRAFMKCARVRLPGGGLAAAVAGDDERDAADQGDAAEDGWDGDGAGLLMLDLEGAEFGVLFFVGEAEASDGEADDADDDEEDADEGGRFHAEGCS